MNIVNLILKKITEDITLHLTHTPVLNCSMLGGHFGEIVYLYRYSDINKGTIDVANKFLEKLFTSIKETKHISCTYCDGLAGLGVGLSYLESKNYILGVQESLTCFDSVIAIALDNAIGNNNIDFLHGYIGIGYYFLNRYPYEQIHSSCQLRKILRALESTAIFSFNTAKWKLNQQQKYNISLSHGMASVVLFLLDLLSTIKLNAEEKECSKNMINYAINYILEQQIDYSIYGSSFPTFPKEVCPPSKSRLAWCYGDLGIAYSLWRVGADFDNKDLQVKALTILGFCCERKDLKSNCVVDGGVCHGASGIAMIFQHLYANTHEIKFFESYNYWIQALLKLGVKEHGSCKFYAFDNRVKQWIYKKSIIEGIAGIGLTLLSSVTNDWSWNKLFIL